MRVPFKSQLLVPVVVLLGYHCFSQTSGATATGANIDVKYHRCNWQIDPNVARSISGTVTTYFVTTQDKATSLALDFNKASYNNAALQVFYHGIKLVHNFPASGNQNKLRFSFPAPLAIGKLDSVTISYAGTAPLKSGLAYGLQQGAYAGNNNAFTYSESFEERNWWPCKADMQDKIDSMDISVTTPWSGADTFWVVAPGRLTDITVTGTQRRFTYQVRYPVASYQVALSVAKYNRYQGTPLTSGNTTVATAYYLFTGKNEISYNKIIATLDQAVPVAQVFSNRWGAYPYAKEKLDFYEFSYLGVSAHPGAGAIGSASLTDWSAMAYNVAHQWFGSKVTFGTWSHAWLSKGFSRYAEILAAQWVPGLQANADSTLAKIQSAAMDPSLDTTTVYVPAYAAASTNGIWGTTYATAVYERGAMVVSMLRTLLGDELFSRACYNYLNDPALAYRSATTEDLKNHFEAVCGKDLDPFFNEWVYGNGYPSYKINWAVEPAAKRVHIQVGSYTVTEGAATNNFHTPLVFRIRGQLPAQDTTIVLYDWLGKLSVAGNNIGNEEQPLFSISLPFTPTAVTFDPHHALLVKADLTELATLPVQIDNFIAKTLTATNEVSVLLSDAEVVQKAALEKSRNSIDFTDAGIMVKLSSSGIAARYSIEDTGYAKVTFYRLRINTRYGETVYSPAIRVQKGTGNELSVFTVQPAKIIAHWTNNIPNQRLQVIDAQGRVMKQLTPSDNIIHIACTGWPKGVYVVRLLQPQGIVASKAVVIMQ